MTDRLGQNTMLAVSLLRDNSGRKGSPETSQLGSLTKPGFIMQHRRIPVAIGHHLLLPPEVSCAGVMCQLSTVSLCSSEWALPWEA